MRISLIILLVLTSGVSFSQEWRDSLMQARNLYKKGQYEESLKYYQSAQRLAPESIDLSQETGQSAFRAQQYEEAEKLFSRAASRQSDSKKKSSAYNNQGYTRMQQKDYSGAEESFKNALRTNPSNEKARQNLAEAKRIRKKQEEEQQKKNQQDNKNQDQQDQQDNKGQQNQKQGGQQKDNKGNNKNEGQQNSQNKGSSSGEQQDKGGTQPKLSDKQTDRKLDELMRREMGTQKQLGGNRKGNGNAVRKDW